MDFQWHQIESFLVAAKNPSFAKAAESLYISPSALTQQMATLEKTLGFSLFARSSSGITLTPCGEVFYENMERMNHELDETLRMCRQLAEKHRVLRVGSCSQWNREHLFRNTLLAFTLKYPDIDIEYIPTSRESMYDDCASDKLDVCLTTDQRRTLPAKLEYRKCAQCSVSVIMSQENPLCKKSSIKAEDLSGQIVLVDQDYGSPAVYEWLNSGFTGELKLLRYNIEIFLETADDHHVLLFASRLAELVRPLTNRPVNPPIDFETGLVFCKNHPSSVDDFVEFMVGKI